VKIKLDREKILNLEDSLRKEYLLTNGLGGYASSTVIQCHTRKYHGLLNLPISRYGKTFNLLSKLDVSAVISGKEFNLSTNKFPEVFHPTGHQYVDSFEMDNYPRISYLIGDTVIVMSFLMPYQKEAVLMRFDVKSAKKPLLLKIAPLLAYRDMHSLSHENMHIRPRTYMKKNEIKIEPYAGMPPLYLQTSKTSRFYPSPMWLNNLEFLKERNRGYDYQEDLFSPGIFEVKLTSGSHVIFRASLSKYRGRISKEWDVETGRAKKEAKVFSRESEPLKALKQSAGHYLVQNKKRQKGIISGYHWFQEWGRDTMISMAGITVCRKDHASALSILKKYGGLVKNGLMPNYLSDHGAHAYNAIDTSLLFFWAVQQYVLFSGDNKSVRRFLLKPMIKVVTDFLRCRVPVATLKENGLLYAGTQDTQLTWMDARVQGKPVTPRNGAAVEINALWYNALSMLYNDFSENLGKVLRTQLIEKIQLFQDNFIPAFWNHEDQCLADVVPEEGRSDLAIRPNQLFAVGLPYSCVDDEKAGIVVETVKKHLVTPYGLRTLSPRNPNYEFLYQGPPEKRDRAYHQGMVWPWLIGIFIDSLLRVYPKTEVKKYLNDTFKDLWKKHLKNYGLFHLSEILTPNPPYTPKGAMAQAWSMAELIRSLENLKS
jgi:predicted glycogen debranching enzyme